MWLCSPQPTWILCTSIMLINGESDRIVCIVNGIGEMSIILQYHTISHRLAIKEVAVFVCKNLYSIANSNQCLWIIYIKWANGG